MGAYSGSGAAPAVMEQQRSRRRPPLPSSTSHRRPDPCMENTANYSHGAGPKLSFWPPVFMAQPPNPRPRPHSPDPSPEYIIDKQTGRRPKNSPRGRDEGRRKRERGTSGRFKETHV
ncbi:uncharacterized protein [Narcine bancroftii]|uniref:uncharacterized protein isoform X3 n=1 Tax=Narcine bancroftii TaxID=1343680 RepID=UPI003831EBF9